jgi:hypothetical protein
LALLDPDPADQNDCGSVRIRICNTARRCCLGPPWVPCRDSNRGQPCENVCAICVDPYYFASLRLLMPHPLIKCLLLKGAYLKIFPCMTMVFFFTIIIDVINFFRICRFSTESALRQADRIENLKQKVYFLLVLWIWIRIGILSDRHHCPDPVCIHFN